MKDWNAGDAPGTPYKDRTPLKPVIQFDDLWLFECPLSCIPTWVWTELTLVGQCTDNDGVLKFLPYPGLITDQPERFRNMVETRRTELCKHRNEEMEKLNKRPTD
jgi:hypothetical protein